MCNILLYRRSSFRILPELKSLHRKNLFDSNCLKTKKNFSKTKATKKVLDLDISVSATQYIFLYFGFRRCAVALWRCSGSLEMWWLIRRCGLSLKNVVDHYERWWLIRRCGGSSEMWWHIRRCGGILGDVVAH